MAFDGVVLSRQVVLLRENVRRWLVRCSLSGGLLARLGAVAQIDQGKHCGSERKAPGQFGQETEDKFLSLNSGIPGLDREIKEFGQTTIQPLFEGPQRESVNEVNSVEEEALRGHAVRALVGSVGPQGESRA